MSRQILCCVLALCGVGVCGSAAAGRIERGTLVFDNVPDAAAEPNESLDGYLRARQATPLGWSPKGQLVIATRFGDTTQLHLVEAPLSDRRQLTFGDEPVDGAVVSPDPLHPSYAFLHDVRGDGHAQLYYQRLGDPTPKLLTDGKSSNGGAVWSNTGRKIAFFSTARTGSETDIDIVEPEAGTLPQLVISGGGRGTWYALDWSPDDRKLLVCNALSSGEDSLYVVELASGQKRELDTGSAKAGLRSARFSRDGQGVYLVSNRDAEWYRVRYVNLFTGDRKILSGPIPGDVAEMALSRDGHYLAYVSDDAGTDKLSLLDLKAGQDLIGPKLPSAGLIDHLNFDLDGKRLVFGWSSSSAPRDAFVYDVAAHRLEQWTRSEPGAVDTSTFVAPRLVHFPTFDREDNHSRDIPAYVYEPARPGLHPVLLLPHGGPEAQFRPGFDPWLQYLVGRLGYAVVVANLRGSGGYGKTYRALDDGAHRDDVIKDLGALIVWVDAQPSFDAAHVVVAGQGYGGFLALSALANYGDRLRGGVDVAGITDLPGYLAAAPASAQDALRAEFGDERDADVRSFLRRLSPLTLADRIAKPLLIVHGAKDPDILLAQSDDMVNRLRSRGAVVWYLIATNQGQEFRSRAVEEAYYRTFAQFLNSLRQP